MNDFQVTLKDGKLYTIKLLNIDTIKDLTRLFNVTKKHEETTNYFISKYLKNYLDISFPNFLLFDGETPIGFSGVILNHLKNKNRQIILGQLGDLLVHPDYRGIGVQSYLLNLVSESCVKHNINGLFVSPNKQAEPIFANNKDWRMLNSLFIFSFKIKTYPLLKILNKWKMSYFFMRFYKFIYSKTFNSSIKWDSNLYSTEKYYPIRSESFFRYKLYKDYTISVSKGVKFIWSLDDGIVIGDWENKEGLSIYKVYQILKNYCQLRGIHMFRFITTGDNYWCNQLINLQQPYKSLNLYFKSFDESIDFQDICLNSFDRNAF